MMNTRLVLAVLIFVVIGFSALEGRTEKSPADSAWNELKKQGLKDPLQPGKWLQSWERNTQEEYVPEPPKPESVYTPTVRKYEFDIHEVVTNIDATPRVQTLVNGQYPGPMIEAVVGDRVVVRVKNLSREPTSLHFHGLPMNGTNYLDGASGVNQCPIAPGQDYTYDFVATISGTYWYHSHWQLQYLKGFVGPLIIHSAPHPEIENDELIDDIDIADKELVVMLTDAYDADVNELMINYYEPYIGGDEPAPDLALMNGKRSPLFPIEEGQLYRIRVINACSYLAFQFSIDNHLLEVVEADGFLTKPYLTPYVPISSGQRYSMLMETKPVGAEPLVPAYWMRATVQRDSLSQLALTNPDTNIEHLSVMGILSYPMYTQLVVKGTHAAPLSMAWRGATRDNTQQFSQMFDIGSLDPLVKSQIPMPDKTVILDAGMVSNADGAMHGAFNNEYYIPRTHGNALLPFTKQVGHRSGKFGRKFVALDGTPRNTALEFSRNEVVEFVVKNFDDGPHPFHLHGHKFWVISKGYNGNYPKPLVESMDPISRDTVVVADEGWVRIRFVADNPGVWLFHCHNMWHSASGMELEFVVGREQLLEQKPDPQWYDLCLAQDA